MAYHTYVAIILTIGLPCTVSLAVGIRKRKEIISFLSRNKRTILIEEILFLAFFFLTWFIKMGSADLWGAEKFPDFSIFNRFYTDTSFPPLDNWLSGYPINYYYMGHLIWGAFGRMIAIPAAYFHNLSLVFIISMIFSSAFSLAYNMTKRLSIGLFAGLCTALVGNLSAVEQIITGGIKSFNWWESSRVIENTINEFPYWSFQLGDFHAHFTSLPVFMILIASLISVFSQGIDGQSVSKTKSRHALNILLISLPSAIASAINPWNFPPCILLVILCAFILRREPDATLRNRLSVAIIYGLSVAALSLLMFLPFYLSYSPPPTSLKILPRYVASDIYEFLIVFGFPMTFISLYLAFSLKEHWGKKALLMLLVSIALSTMAIIYKPAAVVGMLCILLCLSAVFACLRKPLGLLEGLFTFSLLILLGCEFLFIDDYFRQNLQRFNTVFKFHYIAYCVLLMLTPVALSQIRARSKNRIFRWTVNAVFVLLFTASAVYLPIGTWGKDVNMKGRYFYKDLTLNGERFLQKDHPDEYKAMRWIMRNTPPDSVILEATGPSYQYYGRFATFTGRLSVLGWSDHEWVWRPKMWDKIKERKDDVARIYSSTDETEITRLINLYKVNYIVVGSLERGNYQATSLNKLADIYSKVFETGKVVIYKTK